MQRRIVRLSRVHVPPDGGPPYPPGAEQAYKSVDSCDIYIGILGATGGSQANCGSATGAAEDREQYG
jgi:hypothetical protein